MLPPETARSGFWVDEIQDTPNSNFVVGNVAKDVNRDWIEN
jgi:hypothetical protein